MGFAKRTLTGLKNDRGGRVEALVQEPERELAAALRVRVTERGVEEEPVSRSIDDDVEEIVERARECEIGNTPRPA